MGPVERTLRYIRAYTGIPELNAQTDALLDRPADLIRAMNAYRDSFLQPVQVVEELRRLVEEVRRLRPKAVLEIGTHRGGTFYLWARLADPDAILLSIDLPGGRFGGGYSHFRAPIYRRFARERQKIHLLRADSHHRSTLRKAEQLLEGRRLELLYVDGDHTYEGVRQDWEMYAPLVRPGGLVAFHDVAGNYGETRVKAFWDGIKQGFPHREYLVHPEGLYGIGVLEK